MSSHSLIFTAASSQYLSRTGSTSVNQQKFTLATWFKRSSTGSSNRKILSFGDGTGNNYFNVSFTSTDHIQILAAAASPAVANKITTATYTDTTSWHHLVVAVDTTQATANDRVRVYVDGTEVTVFSTNLNPSLNLNFSNNYAVTYKLGTGIDASGAYWNGLLDQFYYIDGQQLTPSSFISGTPGIIIPYAGTYTGVFSFFLSFDDNSSTTTLGHDDSGQGNNWTLNAMTTANASSDIPPSGYSDSVAEAAAALDVIDASSAFLASITETNSISDLVSSLAGFIVAIAESISASDLILTSPVIIEAASAADTISSSQSLGATTVETATAADAVGVILNALATVAELASVLDDQSGRRIPPPRFNTGKITLVMFGSSGTPLNVNEAGTIIVNIGRGALEDSGPLINFILPSGEYQNGDPVYAYIGRNDLPSIGAIAGQYVVYNVAADEMATAGRWGIYVRIGAFTSKIGYFRIING